MSSAVPKQAWKKRKIVEKRLKDKGDVGHLKELHLKEREKKIFHLKKQLKREINDARKIHLQKLNEQIKAADTQSDSTKAVQKLESLKQKRKSLQQCNADRILKFAVDGIESQYQDELEKRKEIQARINGEDEEDDMFGSESEDEEDEDVESYKHSTGTGADVSEAHASAMEFILQTPLVSKVLQNLFKWTLTDGEKYVSQLGVKKPKNSSKAQKKPQKSKTDSGASSKRDRESEHIDDGDKQAADRKAKKSKKTEAAAKSLHPSWEAKKQLQEAAANAFNVEFTGKKITFGDDE